MNKKINLQHAQILEKNAPEIVEFILQEGASIGDLAKKLGHTKRVLDKIIKRYFMDLIPKLRENNQAAERRAALVAPSRRLAQLERFTPKYQELIRTGASGGEAAKIMHEAGCGYKVFCQLTKLYGRLKPKSHAKIAALERYKRTLEKDGEKIERMILNGNHIQPIIAEMKFSATYLLAYLKWASPSLLEQLRSNSKKVVHDNAIKYATVATEANRGAELHPLSPEICDLYQKMVADGKYYTDIRSECEKRGYYSRKLQQLINRFGPPNKKPISGEHNAMYGRPAPSGSGIGANGRLLLGERSFYFRSNLELKYFLYFSERNINFAQARFMIPYQDSEGTKRNYWPDLIIDKKIYEIKPSNLTKLTRTKEKDLALQNFCSGSNEYEYGGFLTEKTVDLGKYDLQYVMNLYDEGKILVTENNLRKIKEYA